MTDMFRAARSFMRYALEDGISEKALRQALACEAQQVRAAQVGTHGLGAYTHWSCRCEVCRRAMREWKVTSPAHLARKRKAA